MTSGDPRERLIDDVARHLHAGPLMRRRILTELADHIDDTVDELCSSGVPREDAVMQALERLGEPQTLADAFTAVRHRSSGWLRRRRRHSLAWIAVAAMSLVTGWAAELPQASGAKAPADVSAPAVRVAPTDRQTSTPPTRRAPTEARRRHGRLGDRR